MKNLTCFMTKLSWRDLVLFMNFAGQTKEFNKNSLRRSRDAMREPSKYKPEGPSVVGGISGNPAGKF